MPHCPYQPLFTPAPGVPSLPSALVPPETPSDSDHKKKKKKKEEDPERKRKKKEKKKKKVSGERQGLFPSLCPPWGMPGSELDPGSSTAYCQPFPRRLMGYMSVLPPQNRHSPEHPGVGSSQASSSSLR